MAHCFGTVTLEEIAATLSGKVLSQCLRVCLRFGRHSQLVRIGKKWLTYSRSAEASSIRSIKKAFCGGTSTSITQRAVLAGKGLSQLATAGTPLASLWLRIASAFTR